CLLFIPRLNNTWIHIYMTTNQLFRCQSHPLLKRYIIITVTFKNLQKSDGLIANIFNIMTLGKGHISNVTSLIVKSPYLYMCMRTRIKNEKSFLKSFSLKKASHTRSY